MPPDDPLPALAGLSRPPAPPASPSYVLVLAEYRPGARLWGLGRLIGGPRALRDEPGLTFCKVLGSGRDGGFGLAPSFSRQGLFCAFATDAAARAFVQSPRVALLAAQAREFLVARLTAYSSRGAWSGQPLRAAAGGPGSGPIGALTRASIRMAAAPAFWGHAPRSQDALAAADGCLLAAGLGEAPLLRQATFSLWRSEAAMDAYARGGAHLEAIRAAARHRFFTESLFMRFVPLRVQGTWQGRSHDLVAAA
jgi:hypothetical protein